MRVLGAIEASTLNANADLSRFRREVEADLQRNAEVFERLREVVLSVADYRVAVNYPHNPATALAGQRMTARLSRLAHAVSRTPDALPLLSDTNRLVIEAQRTPAGTWALRQPLQAA